MSGTVGIGIVFDKENEHTSYCLHFIITIDFGFVLSGELRPLVGERRPGPNSGPIHPTIEGGNNAYSVIPPQGSFDIVVATNACQPTCW